MSACLNALATEGNREDMLAQVTRLIEESDRTAAAHAARVTELLEANNREVERRRIAERALKALQAATLWTLADLQAANIVRDAEWRPKDKPPLDLSFRGNELAGEVGEACNFIKKLERERLGWPGSRATREQLAEELADVVICVSLAAMTAGIDLMPAVSVKFNSTSQKMGLATRLPGEPVQQMAPPSAELRTALATAIAHIKHMAAWITAKDAGYSFEALGEDMPGMEAALAALSAERSVIGKTLPETGNKLHQENGEATALTAPPASAAPPAIYVSAQQLDNAPNLPSRYLPFRLAPEGLFQTALFRAAQVAVPDGWALVPATATREWATSYATWKFGQSATPRCESPGEIDIEWAATLIRNMLSVAPAPPPPTLPAEPEGEPLTFTYRNWRGEIAERRAIPRRVYFGATEWHPEPQWLLRALDVDKGAERDFALKDATFSAHPAAQPGMRVKGLEEVGKTPRGYTIFREVNEVGGHRYWSDEIGGGVCVWDTCLADAETLRECLQIEEGAPTSPTAEEYQRGAGWMQSEAARLVREAQGAFGSVVLAEKIMSLPLTSGKG